MFGWGGGLFWPKPYQLCLVHASDSKYLYSETDSACNISEGVYVGQWIAYSVCHGK